MTAVTVNIKIQRDSGQRYISDSTDDFITDTPTLADTINQSTGAQTKTRAPKQYNSEGEIQEVQDTVRKTTTSVRIKSSVKR